jgi:hypothetical protein
MITCQFVSVKRSAKSSHTPRVPVVFDKKFPNNNMGILFFKLIYQPFK